MSIVPQAVGSLAAFERIQQYLLQPPRRDQRLIPKEAVGGTAKARPSIRLDRVTIQNNVSSPPFLKDISITVDQGAIVVCSGPVGCGKTTLAKAVLGEVPVASGTISVASKRIGYCEQSPWLPSGTLKDAICGYLPHDVAWYQKVVKICCLEYDILALPYGEQTMIGSRGLNLSGGQRQRVVCTRNLLFQACFFLLSSQGSWLAILIVMQALARALYARCDIVLLDDCFSALDGKTETRIIENLFGSTGLFRQSGTTVFVFSNSGIFQIVMNDLCRYLQFSATYFSFADWLVVLGNASVQYQGVLADLAHKSEGVLKVKLTEPQDEVVGEKRQEDLVVQRQNLQLAEAISDLSRATGDFSLYGKNAL